MKQETRTRLARRLGLSAGWAGLALLAAVVLFDTLWSAGAQFVKYGLAWRYETLHHVVVIWWLPFCVALCAGVVALVADPAGLPRRGRPTLMGIAVLGVLGSLYGLRFVAHADHRLRDMYSWTWSPQAWLVWTGLVIWVALLISIVLGAAALLARRSMAADQKPAGGAILAAHIAFWASIAALVTLLIEAVRLNLWSSSIMDAMVAQGFGGRRWLATAVVLLAQVSWPVAGVAAATLAARRSRAVWALLGGAGVCGLLVSGSAAIVALQSWAEISRSTFLGMTFLPNADLSEEGVWAFLEPSREASLTSLIVHGLLFMLAAMLVVAATRHYVVWRDGRAGVSLDMGRPEESSLALLRGRVPMVAAAVAVILAVLAPLIADALVTDGGALLGTGGVRSPAAAQAAALPTATSPTPIPNGDESPSPESPRIVGVVPGNRRGGGEVRSWNGNLVEVNVDPNGVGLDLAASELTINGQRVTGQPTTPELTPATRTVVWSLAKYYGKESFDFVVTLVAMDGRRFAFGWSYSAP